MTPGTGKNLSDIVPDEQSELVTLQLFSEFFNSASRMVHQNALDHGWHEKPRTPGDLIALMHAELSEALEEIRDHPEPTHVYVRESDGKPEGFGVEIADVIIRAMDTAELMGIDLGGLIVEKMIFNKSRPYRHGGKLL